MAKGFNFNDLLQGVLYGILLHVGITVLLPKFKSIAGDITKAIPDVSATGTGTGTQTSTSTSTTTTNGITATDTDTSEDETE